MIAALSMSLLHFLWQGTLLGVLAALALRIPARKEARLRYGIACAFFTLMATAPNLTRNHMEVRGIGIINVANIFGIGSIRIEKRLDLVVTLKEWEQLEEVDRIGLDQEYYEILGMPIPHVTIPVRPGRDIARLIEVAAMDQKLKGLGKNSAVEFNAKLLNLMEPKDT